MIGVGVFRIELDRLGVVGDGAVVVALVAVRDTAVVVGGGVLGIEPDRLAEVGDGAVIVLLVYVQLDRDC